MSSLTSTDRLLHAFVDEVGSEGPVAVTGKQTRWSIGGSPTEGTRFVDAPAGIVDYRPAEMTVVVRAGTTVVELEATLGEAGQRTALPQRGGTVGGAVAVGESHLEALGRGPMRNGVLQVRYVSSEGQLVTGGGPTVKNVSGFNLPKLLTGSLGTLGLIGELILRTNPIPPTRQWFRTEAIRAREVFDTARAAACILTDGESTHVLLEGHGIDVAAEVARLEILGDLTAVDAPPELPPHRWSLAPAELPGLDETSRHPDPFVASVGVGMMYTNSPQPQRPLDPATKVVGDRMKALFDPTGRLNPGRNPQDR